MADFELHNALAIVDQVAAELESVAKCSLDPARKYRRIGEDGFDHQAMLDPEEPRAVAKTVAWILATAAGRPISFAALENPPQLAMSVNVSDKRKKVRARVLEAWHHQENRSIWRIDFLFKVANA